MNQSDEKERKRRWWQRRPKPSPGYDHCVPAASHTCDECKRILPDPPTWLPPGHVFVVDPPGPRPAPTPARPDEVFPPGVNR